MYKVILTGVREGVARQDAVKSLAALFKTTPEQVEKLLATPGFVLKKGITEEVAGKYKAAIEAAGGACRLELVESSEQSLDVNLPEPTSSPAIPSIGKNLIPCASCGNNISKSADNCPTCGAKNGWTDPRRDDLVSYLHKNGKNFGTEAWQFYGDRFSVWGNTEFKTKSFVSFRYAIIALVIGVILNFMALHLPLTSANAKSIWQAVITFGPFIAFPLAFIFFGIWVYHSLFTLGINDVLQKQFRVDFSGDKPIWQSNDEDFWKPIKDYVTARNGVLSNPVYSTNNQKIANTTAKSQNLQEGQVKLNHVTGWWSSIRQAFLKQSTFAKIGIVIILVPCFLFASWGMLVGLGNQIITRHAEAGADSLGNIWSPPISGTWQCDNATQNRPWEIWTFDPSGKYTYLGVEGIVKGSGQYHWDGGAALKVIDSDDPVLNQTWNIIKAAEDRWLMTNGRFEVICHQ